MKGAAAVAVLTALGLLAAGGAPLAAGGPSGATCLDDAFEQNDPQQDAAPVALPFHAQNLRVCPGDDDWFAFPLTAARTVQIDAFFRHTEGDIDIRLHDPKGDIVAASLSYDDDESISYVATSSDTYALRVNLFGSEPPPTGTRYDLRIFGPTGDVNCDGLVSSVDAALVLQLNAALLDALPCEDNADVNLDGTTNAIDVALILQYTAGLIDTLPPG